MLVLLLPPFVVLPVGKSGVDIVLLTLLGTAAKQNHETIGVFPKVNTVAGPKVAAACAFRWSNQAA
jgi:hypothetical protein